MGYQIGFDLYESATQQFLNKIRDALRVQAPIPIILDKQQQNKDEQQRYSHFFKEKKTHSFCNNKNSIEPVVLNQWKQIKMKLVDNQ